MKTFDVEATRNFPAHEKILQAVLNFFYAIPGVVGCFLIGSMATNEMDPDSDLDIGILFQGDEDRERVWQKRWDWEIAPWFHRFDADHIKPYFVIYLYEPQIKADLNLYVENDLPPAEAGTFEILWDHKGVLGTRLKTPSKPQPNAPNWREVVHEDERFWAWLFYSYQHVHRGEYYHIAYEFSSLRDLVEKWAARLAGASGFSTRRLEKEAFGKKLLDYDLFPKPDRVSLKASLLDLIEIQLLMRKEIGAKLGIN